MPVMVRVVPPLSRLGVLRSTVGANRAVTVKVVLGPAPRAVFPTRSLAESAAMLMPSVPTPVMLESVTVRVLPLLPETLMVALAVPVVLRVMWPAASVMLFAPA